MLSKIKVFQNSANCVEVTVGDVIYMSSYGKVICAVDGNGTYLDKNYWRYSTTTAKHRNGFLDMSTKEIEAMIESGDFKLVDLN